MTPRQQQILELANIGLSDDEIAARLSSSSRTIRFQLERVFRVLGVRTPSQAVAMWIHSRRHPRRPVDECPYPKPFPDHFAKCPAYQARQVVDLNEKDRPVGRIWTCQHLEARRRAEVEFSWYGACILGDSASRTRWAEEAGPSRVRTVNHLVHELAPIAGPFAERLWALKGDQVRALRQKQDPMPSTQSMEALAGRFMAEVDAFLNERRVLLDYHHLSIGACRDRARQLISHVLDQRSPAGWDGRFDALMRFPEDAWSAQPIRSPSSAS